MLLNTSCCDKTHNVNIDYYRQMIVNISVSVNDG